MTNLEHLPVKRIGAWILVGIGLGVAAIISAIFDAVFG